MRLRRGRTAIATLLSVLVADTARGADFADAVRWRSPPAPGWTCARSPTDVPRMPEVDMDPSIRSYCLGPDGEVATVSVADASDTSMAFDSEAMLSSVSGSADPTWTLWKDKAGKTLNASDYLADERGRRAGSMTIAVVSGKGYSSAKGAVPTVVLKAQMPVHLRSHARPPEFGQVIVVFDVLARLRGPVIRNSSEIARLEGLTRNWAASAGAVPEAAVRIPVADYAASRPEQRGTKDAFVLTPDPGPGHCSLLWEATSTDLSPIYVDILVDGQVAVRGYASTRKGWYRWPAGDANAPCARAGKHLVTIEARSSPGGAIIGREKDPVLMAGATAAPKVKKARAFILERAHVVVLFPEPATADGVKGATWKVCARPAREACEDDPGRVVKADGEVLIDFPDRPFRKGTGFWLRSSVRAPDGAGELEQFSDPVVPEVVEYP